MAFQSAKDEPIEQSAKGSGKNWKRNLIGILISGLCLGFIAWKIDLAELKNALSTFQWTYLVWGILSLAFGYTMRIVRWSLMLRAAGAQVAVSACVAPFLGSIAMNNTLPMRVGDVMRALVFPSAIGVGKTTATGSLVMERLVDLMTLLACLMIGLALSPKAHLPEWLAATSVTLALTGGITLALVFLFSGRLSRLIAGLATRPQADPNSGTGKIYRTLGDLLGSFDAMSRLPVLLSLSGLSIFVWMGEAGLFWALLRGFGLDAGPETAIIVMAIATLSTLVPSSPGYVGPFHLAAYAAISMLGGTPGQAASFAIVSHLAVWLPTTLAGAIAILLNPQLFGGVKAKAATLKSL